ncbi:hypothetical protein C8Q80DRAFT_1293357 [Daedaleopsis nitida]|nr:hypothetical protein C8Q80DRAFT_1293357 [Daedaleopsis nitida]
MSRGYTVTVIGGTGRLGQEISKVFLSEYRASFSTRITTRDPTSVKAQELASNGAEVYQFDPENIEQSIAAAVQGADVVVNVLPSATTSKATKQQIQAAAINCGTKVYFLSEFGVDHRKNDFPGYDHHEWEVKRELATAARRLAGGKTKVIALYTGLFLEGVFRVIGFDIEHNKLTCVGPPTARVAFTSTADIGRAVARLALLALDAETALQVPDDARIAGCVVSYDDVRELVANVKGLERDAVAITSENLGQLKARLKNGDGSVLEYIRVLMGEGKLDFKDEQINDLVNPERRFGNGRMQKISYDSNEIYFKNQLLCSNADFMSGRDIPKLMDRSLKIRARS